MTGFAIAEYLIVVLEVFLICDVSARGLKPEMVERKESLIYLSASVGMNVIVSVGSKKSFHLAGISGVWLFSGTGGTGSHLDCTAVLHRSRVCRRWDGQHTGIEYQQDHGLYSGIEDL